jgi:hypothetical protein
MKLFRPAIETHQPGNCQAELCFRMTGQSDDLRIPLFGGGVAPFHTLLDLQERMLDSPRMLFINEILGDVGIG